MALRDYPLKINNVSIPFAKSESLTYKNIENENQSETGMDILQITRVGKLTASYSTRLTSEWEPILRGFANEIQPLTVQMYDIDTEDYVTYSMRLRDLSVKRVQYSEDLEVYQGIYDFSFKLVQF